MLKLENIQRHSRWIKQVHERFCPGNQQYHVTHQCEVSQTTCDIVGKFNSAWVDTNIMGCTIMLLFYSMVVALLRSTCWLTKLSVGAMVASFLVDFYTVLPHHSEIASFLLWSPVSPNQFSAYLLVRLMKSTFLFNFDFFKNRIFLVWVKYI